MVGASRSSVTNCWHRSQAPAAVATSGCGGGGCGGVGVGEISSTIPRMNPEPANVPRLYAMATPNSARPRLIIRVTATWPFEAFLRSRVRRVGPSGNLLSGNSVAPGLA